MEDGICRPEPEVSTSKRVIGRSARRGTKKARNRRGGRERFDNGESKQNPLRASKRMDQRPKKLRRTVSETGFLPFRRL
ncbi:unnamed protein product [Chondrus crispus]|uniref:Uncharacterized protein n=1 Tax=Chondrus crispus TaxID=2769 RepID=R7QR65_CHOCR|nr:unnamed protein product [Chondrus crispus]CDF40253.1 unnamed protein product [Chondrus crispus]|eukprot:XP_005710547.1 unnamed protein product [Chondrus crispus]